MRHRPLLAAFVVALVACSSAPSSSEDVGSERRAIVNGMPTPTGYAANGYLATSFVPGSTATVDSFFCGATLVGPNVAVTAAHCICDHTNVYPKSVGVPKDIAMGFGTLGSSPAFQVASALVHPAYWTSAFSTTAQDHDIAVLRLMSPPGVTPAVIGHPKVHVDYQLIGYGGCGADPVGIREELDMTLLSRTSSQFVATNYVTHPTYGDSGSGLMDGAGTIVGEIWDATSSGLGCSVPSAVDFVRLDANQDFIKLSAACGDDDACIAAALGWQPRIDPTSPTPNPCSTTPPTKSNSTNTPATPNARRSVSR